VPEPPTPFTKSVARAGFALESPLAREYLGDIVRYSLMWNRALVVAAIAYTTQPVSADDASVTAVDKLVRAHVDALDETVSVFKKTVAGDAELWTDTRRDLPEDVMCGNAPCEEAVAMFDTLSLRITKTAFTKPTIAVDDANGMAWFHVGVELLDVKATGFASDGARGARGKTTLRLNGIAQKQGEGWKIVAAKYSFALPDAALGKHKREVPKRAMNVVAAKGGDTDVARTIAGWVPGGLAANVTASETLAVNGTSKAEYASNRKAIDRLLKNWDKLKLTVTDVSARTFGKWGNGKLAWVNLVVSYPLKKGHTQFTLSVIAVPEGKGWRWVSLNFAPPTILFDTL